jgi:molecular chaperone GrpE
VNPVVESNDVKQKDPIEPQNHEEEIQGEQTEEVTESEGVESTDESVTDSGVEDIAPEEENVTVTLQEWNQLKQQAEENQNRFLRSQADFDNFRRRTRQEREDLVKYASVKVIESLLPAFDNLERALQSSKQSSDFESLAKGVDMVFRQMEQTLSQEGLQAIEAVGQPFDPELHQAVMQEEVEGSESGIVVEELQKGYKLKDKVLRPSMVKVSV